MSLATLGDRAAALLHALVPVPPMDALLTTPAERALVETGARRVRVAVAIDVATTVTAPARAWFEARQAEVEARARRPAGGSGASCVSEYPVPLR